jgi:hypothetical protein
MRLRSRGLGRKELVMDFRRYEIRRDGADVLITGTITEPVTWDFSIRIEREDIPGLVRVARSKAMISLFFEWVGALFGRLLRRETKGELGEQAVASQTGKAPAAVGLPGGTTGYWSARKSAQGRAASAGPTGSAIHGPAERRSGRAGSDRAEMLARARRALAEQRGGATVPQPTRAPSGRWLQRKVGGVAVVPLPTKSTNEAVPEEALKHREAGASKEPSPASEKRVAEARIKREDTGRPPDGWTVRRVGRLVASG